MKMKRNRNYWLAAIGCLVCTVLAAMGKSGWENIHWFIASDLNVMMWLWVAWLFDDTRAA